MNDDFQDFLAALDSAGVRYLVVGAPAMAVHGVPRATGDLALIANKEATGRPKDEADLPALRKRRN